MKLFKFRNLILTLLIFAGLIMFLSIIPDTLALAQDAKPQEVITGINAAYSVSGYVKDKNGTGIENVTVTFSGTNAPPPTSTNSSGYYTQSGFDDIYSYTLRFSKSGYFFNPAEDDVETSGSHDATGYPISPASLPFSDGFESGLDNAWAFETEYTGRAIIGGGYPHSGSNSILLDDAIGDSSGDDRPAAAILALDLDSHSDVALIFWIRAFDNETPSDDGVFISDDNGATWFQIYTFESITPTYAKVRIILDDAASTAGMSFNDHFLVKFQFQDNFPIPDDGYAIDDVLVSDNSLDGYARDVSGTGISGVTVSFDGAAPAVMTDSGGYYSQFGFSEGNHTIRFSKTGYSFSQVEDEVYIDSSEPNHDTTGYPFNPAGIPFTDNFDTDIFGSAWAIETDYEGRSTISSYAPYSGTYSLLLDDVVSGGYYSHASALLSLDLIGQSNINLTFWYREFLDENHADDGAFISDDFGATWYRVFSFTGATQTYAQVVINLDYAVSQAGMSFNDHFLIKFQYYDNDPSPDDGYVVDNIHVGISENIIYLPLIFK